MKNGVGRNSFNKGWVFFMGERGGKCILHVFAKCARGAEGLRHVQNIMLERLFECCVLCADSARAYWAFILDFPQKGHYLFRINHAKAKTEGFVWKAFVDHEDGGIFADMDQEFAILDVHTELADGQIGNFKKYCNSKGGVTQKHLKAWAKEFQFRQNYGKHDLWKVWMDQFGDVCRAIERGELTKFDVMDSLNWDRSFYQDYSDDETCDDDSDVPDTDEEDSDGSYSHTEMWTCPGCSTRLFRRNKDYHRRTCEYYLQTPERVYNHDTTRCICCVYN